mgnify:CR=1 FL=1
MKVYIVGSIRVNSWLRKMFFVSNLKSLKSVSSLFYWNFNIVGKYADSVRKEILKKYPEAKVTYDNESSYYALIKKQISAVGKNPKTLLYFLMEDHWFVCPHKNVFFYLLEKFYNSKADVLRITHLTELWEHEKEYAVTVDKPLYKEYLTDLKVLKKLWSKYPGSYIVSIPGIFKKEFALRLLENNKSLLQSKKPGGFELFGQKAEDFLTKRSFITMVPTIHVLREVFWVNQDKRAMDASKALKIITLRDKPDTVIKPWRKAVRLLVEPRVLAGKIKRLILR